MFYFLFLFLLFSIIFLYFIFIHFYVLDFFIFIFLHFALLPANSHYATNTKILKNSSLPWFAHSRRLFVWQSHYLVLQFTLTYSRTHRQTLATNQL